MIKILFFCVLVLSINLCHGQSSDRYSELYIEDLYNKASVLQPLQAKQSNFSDLEAIGDAIGSARIILLGEPSHGDGGAIQLKSRLTQYLFEKKGFDVLLFEYDFFPLMFGQDSLQKNAFLDSFISRNMWAFWYKSTSTATLWQYIKTRNATKHPIVINGVDIQHSGEMSNKMLAKQLHKVLSKLKYNTEGAAYKSYIDDLEFAVRLPSLSDKKIDSLENVRIQNRIKQVTGNVDLMVEENERIKLHLRSFAKDTIEQKKWLLELKNIEYFLRLFQGSFNRDKGMAGIAIDLIKNFYPDKKIIIWAHNNHNCLDVNTYASADPGFAKTWYNKGTYDFFTFLGADLYREFGEQVYSLAISSYQGVYSPNFWNEKNFGKTAPVKPSSPGSFEHYLFTKHSSSPVFIPLPQNVQGRPSGYPWFSSKIFDINTEIKMDYTSGYDGIIFIPETFPLKIK